MFARSRFSRTLSLVFVAAVLGSAQFARGDSRGQDFVVPLVGKYSVQNRDSEPEPDEWGRFQIVESIGTGRGGRVVVGAVEQLAVHGTIIVGKTANGFFVLDTATASPLTNPTIYRSHQAWQQGLSEVGVSSNIKLVSPDELAAGLPEQTIRPWNYRTMKGLFGWTDDFWSFIVQMTGFVFAFLVGLFSRRGSLVAPSIIIGLLWVNGLGYMLIGGGGPGALFGIVLFPLVCGLAGLFGRGMRIFVGLPPWR